MGKRVERPVEGSKGVSSTLNLVEDSSQVIQNGIDNGVCVASKYNFCQPDFVHGGVGLFIFWRNIDPEASGNNGDSCLRGRLA